MTEQRVEGLDAEAVQEWIRGLGIEARLPLTFERIGLGQSNLTFLVQDQAGARWVLRRPPLGDLLASAHDVAREYRVLRALRDTDVPVPVVHALCEDPAVSDVPLMVMSYVDGLVLDGPADAENLGERQRHAVGKNLVGALARIHAVDLDATGLTTLASHKPYAARQLRRWAGQWELSKMRELPDLDDLTRRLQEAAPEPGEIVLVHGDCHPRNIIIDPQDGAVKAVLDWELCSLGDPLADIGTVMAYWPQPGDPETVRSDVTMGPGFATRAELLDEYARLTGRDVSAAPFWTALGVWKLAIIMEGVRRRQSDDPRNLSARGHFPQEGVDALVSYAHSVLSGDL